MKLSISMYQVDAFSDKVFSGNPAAVCPLDEWLDEKQMLSIAAENNLSETSFCVREGESYGLRWFTPKAEVQLCGHATLATGFVIFHFVQPGSTLVSFQTSSGQLTVGQDDDYLTMDFPSLPPSPCLAPPRELVDGVGSHSAWRIRDRTYGRRTKSLGRVRKGR